MVPAPSAAQLEPLRRLEALDKGEPGAVRELLAPAAPSHLGLALWTQGDFGLGPAAGGGKLRADLAGLGLSGAYPGQGPLGVSFCGLAGQAPPPGAGQLDSQGGWRPAGAPGAPAPPGATPRLALQQPPLAFGRLPILASGRPGQTTAFWRLWWTWEVERPARQAPSLAELETLGSPGAAPGPGGRP